MIKKQILVLTTGGTIEKSYSETDGSLRNRNSLLKQRLLSKMRLPHTDIELIEVMAKDSLDMTDEDRQKILKMAEGHRRKGRPLVILHGTDTMEQTARLFYDSESFPSETVVFTGAMKPLGFDDSDAMQNIVEALIVAQVLAPGIYVSFHNRVFPLPRVTKDKKLGTFVET